MQLRSIDFGNKNHSLYPTAYIKDLDDWLEPFGLRVGFSEVFKKGTGYNIANTIHIDGDVIDDHVKINFVVNPGTSTMSWYQLKPGCDYRKKVTVVGSVYLYAPEEDCELVARENLITDVNRPALVNAGMLHGIENINTTRYCYSFMLRYKDSNEKVAWDDAVKILGNYITQ
jgi:hypothetical protein